MAWGLSRGSGSAERREQAQATYGAQAAAYNGSRLPWHVCAAQAARREEAGAWRRPTGNGWLCQEDGCHRKYPIRGGLPVLLTEEGDRWADIEAADLPTDTLPAMPARPDIAWLRRKATELRIAILQAVIRAGSGHIGGAFSVTDVMAALYFRVLRHDPSEPAWPERDRLVFSKGHACLALYSALAESGYFPKSSLRDFAADGGLLGGHPERGQNPRSGGDHGLFGARVGVGDRHLAGPQDRRRELPGLHGAERRRVQRGQRLGGADVSGAAQVGRPDGDHRQQQP